MDELAQYPYTGHSGVLGKVKRPWQATEEVLGWFGAARDGARQRYEEFVAAGVAQGRRPDLVGGGLRRSAGAGLEAPRRRRGKEGEEESVYDARVLGSSEFVRVILSEAEWERREILRKARQGTGLAELGATAARLAGITTQELCSAGRWPALVAARRALAQVAIGELGRSGAAVAKYLGVATSTANRAVGGELDPLAQRLLETIEGD